MLSLHEHSALDFPLLILHKHSRFHFCFLILHKRSRFHFCFLILHKRSRFHSCLLILHKCARLHSWGGDIAQWQSAGILIGKLQVWFQAGKFSSPGSTFCADSKFRQYPFHPYVTAVAQKRYNCSTKSTGSRLG